MLSRARYLGAWLWSVWMFLGLRWGLRLARTWPEDGPSNCYLWALQQLHGKGGEIGMVRSRYGGWLHAFWRSPDGRCQEFNPPTKIRRRFPPAVFHGRVCDRERR